MTIKWTLQWLFVSIILSLVNLQKVIANEAISYIPALECYDPYGKPQVNQINFNLKQINENWKIIQSPISYTKLAFVTIY